MRRQPSGYTAVPELGLTVQATAPTIRSRFVKSARRLDGPAASIRKGSLGQSMSQTRRSALHADAGEVMDDSRVVISVAGGQSCRNAKEHGERSEEDSDEMSPLLGRQGLLARVPRMA